MSAVAAPVHESARTAARPELDARIARVTAVAEQHLAAADRDAVFPVQALDELRDTGLLGLVVPTRYGGLGGGLRDVVDAGIALGRCDMSTALIFTMHCQQVAAAVEFAAPPLRDELLPVLGAGRTYLASVSTESGKGGHLYSARAALHRSGAELRIDRFAPVVTGGAHADGFLITMKNADATADNDVALVYASRDQLTVETAGEWQPMGMRATGSAPLKLSGSVPGGQIVGADVPFRDVANRVLGPYAHLGWSASWLGTAAGALSRVLGLVRGPDGRKRFDLGSELLLTRLSTARQRLDAVHAQIRHTLLMLETAPDITAPPCQLLLNGLKLSASEQCLAAVDDLVDAVGLQHGYLKNSPTRLEQSLRDLRSAALNYKNDRLHLADGRLALLDREVSFV
ncbi:acyl-CoA dehydrogenase family protein [Streptomyces sp. SID14515]|uniref:acyl-CoA dehydrogenase family protein n=1 Tax=Streptomyces sp. SID14515 TaxID=2706074 RepID=UPI0013C59FFA|nr:acyl-CoA dehydrogenase family protein [Streptomyces sp. SID14515]NEB39629.1 acyl-CoA/acyl-ACP dehydrogenase [Streptomyces sp. SID14515]